MVRWSSVAVISIASLSLWAQASAPQCFELLAPKDVSLDELVRRPVVSKTKESFKLEISGLFQTLENQYGPLSFKMASMQKSWEKVKVQALRLGNQLQDDYEKYMAFSSFLASFNDGHVSVQLPSTLTWTLPVQFHVANGKLHVGFIAEDYPDVLTRPDLGDEVVEINGQTPEVFQKQFPQFNASGNALTNRSLFGYRLSILRETSGIPLSRLPWKALDLKLKKRGGAGEIYSLTLPYAAEGIGLIHNKDEHLEVPNPPLAISAISKVKSRKPSLKNVDPTTSLFYKLHNLFRTESPVKSEMPPKTTVKSQTHGRPLVIGDYFPFFRLPKDFRQVEIPQEVFQDPRFQHFFVPGMYFAGTFQKDGKKVGYLRVPSYMPEVLEMFPQAAAALASTTRFYIGRLQQESDYLILDQTNNPGGMVIMSDFLIKALVGQYDSSKHMKFAVKPTQVFMRRYRSLIEEIKLNPENLLTESEIESFVSRLETEYEKIHSAYVANRDLSEPISMLAMSDYFEITHDRKLFNLPWGPILEKLVGVNLQNHQTYTKPVFFMVNEFDFSGGDATPGIFQDYGRGLVIGTREKTQTAGAGGTVEDFSIRSNLEIQMQLTTSLMVRKGGKLVENYGVQADLNVPLTADDIANGYSLYFGRVLEAIKAKIQ